MTEEAEVAPGEGNDSPPPDSETAIREIRDALDRAEREAAAAKDLARRAQADLANVQRRARTERQAVRSRLLGEIGSGFLAVLDDLERAVAEVERHATDSADAASDAVATGVRLVLRRFEETLGQHGFTEVKALGESFDPAVHEAAQQAPLESGQQDGEVIAVFRRGYLLEGRLVRPATVVVAVEPPSGAPAPDEAPAENGSAAEGSGD